MKRVIYIILIFCLFNVDVKSQREFPTFSQYISNGLTLNPAYSGSREVLSLNLLYRDQSVGLTGAPVYQYLSGNAPLKNAHIGIGFLVENEQWGQERNTQVYFNYAYRIKIASGKLALGLKAGANFGSPRSLFINDPNDVPFVTNITQSYILPNIGVGIYYYSPHAFIGASVPYFLSYVKNYNQSGSAISNNITNYNFLVTAGYLFNISRDLKIKPSTFIKLGKLQHQSDLNLNFILLNNSLSFGVGYRMNNKASSISDVIIGTLEVQLNPQFRLGYAYDYSSGNNIYNTMSHEISVRYEFSYKIKAINPRYF